MTVPVATPSRFARRLRNGAVVLAVVVAVYALIGFLVLPVMLKPRLEANASELLGRPMTAARLEFNPFTLRARLLGLAIADRDPQRTFVRIESLDLDISPASIRYLAPVLDAVRLVRPQIAIARIDSDRYSIDDVIERLAARPAGPTPAFSISNLEVDDGSIDFDDRPQARKIAVSHLAIGIPFLSSIAHDAKIHVTPHLEGQVDGAPFRLAANSTSPFADVQQATLEWNVDALPLARYAGYVPLPGGAKLAHGTLTARLTLAFVTDRGTARNVALSGTARVDDIQLARSDGSTLAGAKSIDVALAKLDWLARSVALAHVVVAGPQIDVRRDANGVPELARLANEPATAAAASAAPTASKPWQYSIGETRIENGTVRITDAAVTPSFAATVSNVALQARQLASSGAPGSMEVAFDALDGAHVALSGHVDLANLAASGHLALTKLDVTKLQPYYASAVAADVRRGSLDVATDFDARVDGGRLHATTSGGSAALADFDAALHGERDPFLRVGHLDVTGVSADVARRELTIDSVQWRGGHLRAVRDRDGSFAVARLVSKPSSSERRHRIDDARGDASATSEQGWNFRVARASAERVAADFEDRTQQPAVRLRIPDARFTVADVGSAPKGRATVDAAIRVGTGGRLRLRGSVATDSFATDLRVDAAKIDLVPLRPYFESRTNIVLTRGAVSAQGRVAFATARGAASSARYTGDVTFTDLATLDRPTSQELVRWKSLAITGIDAKPEPLHVTVGAIAMDGFYARVILNDDATLNVARLLVPQPAEADTAGKTTVAGVTTKTLPAPAESRELPVSIGRIVLSDGEVQYSDYFVKPNYTAHLTNVAGTVTALSATQAGTVALTARVEDSAPVELRGTVNPFARELALDLAAKASDVDLPPLTPYSVKYAGYGIRKGKLSLEVHYRIDDRKLAASNKLRLDQLTFGEHVDSPTATKLPVLLAVSLLKDRNGVINLDLPIEGTLDDPQFSIWHVLVQIVVNLVTKAATAPFALLGAIAGGGQKDLAYVAFAPGRAELSDDARKRLATLAKALSDRPGVTIDASGRASGDVDRAGLERAMLEQALRAQKAKALAASGESAPALDTMTIDSGEYPKLLTEVYRDSDVPDKPRNAFGMLKTIPPAEMESRLLAAYRVDDAALAALANRRATAVKQWFTSEGGLPGERIFIVAPKLGADGIKDGGTPTRVDFAIR
ncbi:MAG TPA: DUF748 domain-containing protein [Casimicrobiaceae bacterium]